MEAEGPQVLSDGHQVALSTPSSPATVQGWPQERRRWEKQPGGGHGRGKETVTTTAASVNSGSP